MCYLAFRRCGIVHKVKKLQAKHGVSRRYGTATWDRVELGRERNLAALENALTGAHAPPEARVV
jgi:hypothetical protein